MAQWKQYSGMWTRQAQMQAAGAQNWTNVLLGNTLWSAGYSNYGQLALNISGFYARRSSPTQIGSLATWAAVAAGVGFAGGVDTTGRLWTWGYNVGGELGQNNTTYRSSPVQVGALTNWALIYAGSANIIGITTSGAAFGSGNGYALGLGASTYRSSPVQVQAGYTWSKLSLGAGNCFGLTTNGSLYGWGQNGYGSVGNNSTAAVSSAYQVSGTWLDVTSGGAFTAAIRSNGTLWAWGYNGTGTLGQDNTISRSSPVQIGALTNWVAVYGNSGYTFYAKKSDGTLWGVGEAGSYYLLGSNPPYGTSRRSSPVQVSSIDFSWVSARGSDVGAITAAGQYYAWGDNQYGQVGRNNITSPIQTPTSIASGDGQLLSVGQSFRILNKEVRTSSS